MNEELSVPSDDLSAYRDELSAIERRVAREVSFGRRRPVVLALIGALVVSLFLPHAGGHTAIAVLGGVDATAATVPVRIFLGFGVVFGIGVSTLAVVTRRWSLSWLAMIGTAMGIVFGLFARWSQQSMPADVRPSTGGYGLLLAWGVVALLAVQWASLTWSRANVMQPGPRPAA